MTFVAISRSSVSGRVVYRSRGKPLNAERVVFMTMRSSTPASTIVPSRVAATVATRVPSPPRTNALGAATPSTSIGRQPCSRMLTVARSTCGVVEEVLGERRPIVLDRAVEVLLGERVGRVLHRVGGDDVRVVAVGVGGREVALERDGDGQVAQPVRRRVAPDPDEPDRRLAVAVRREFDHRDASFGARGQSGMPVAGDVDDRVEARSISASRSAVSAASNPGSSAARDRPATKTQ